ncbi:MAG: CCA tRNA nucleotidyltransferase [Clostridiales bacterium]|nr:CCA tRNA nucleotidyltransferase [Clostridiales bacterium]
MREILPEFLRLLAQNLPAPLYLVGGMVRNFLAGLPTKTDLDVAAALPVEEIVSATTRLGGKVHAVYPKTGTVQLSFDGGEIEYTRFRTERYPKGGVHTPCEVLPTQSIEEDAKRRDFTINAIYYDIAGDRFCDPLGGMEDIKTKSLRAYDGKKVFESDGLRLMRLARFAAQLNFSVHPDTLSAAREYKTNLRDIAGERLNSELSLLLLSDTAYPVSGKDAPLRGLKVLRETGVLFELFPALKNADGMPQRKDYHDHDVLTHSLRAVFYAPPILEVRLAALLHDIGKPTAFYKSGKPTSETPAAFAGHERYGEPLVLDCLKRIKASNHLTHEVSALCRQHGYVAHENTRQVKLRRFLSENAWLIPNLFYLMQADHSAQKGEETPSACLSRLMAEYARMCEENVPFSIKDLAVSGNDLTALGLKGKEIGEMLNAFLQHCMMHPQDNQKNLLISRAKRIYKRKQKQKEEV